MDFILGTIASVLPFIIILGTIVVIHELGHYAAGRVFGAAVETYAVGFGRPLLQITDRRNTRWSLNLLPFGGFVKFADQHSADIQPKPLGKDYQQLPAWQRFLVALAGPLANFVLAALIFTILAMVSGVEVRKPIEIMEVMEGQPAAAAGVLPGDRIIAIDGKTTLTPNDVISMTRFRSGDELIYTIRRNDELLDIPIIPQRRKVVNELMQETEAIGRIGLQMRSHERQTLSLPGAIRHGIGFTADLTGLTNMVMLRILSLKEPTDHLRGPVGIWDVSSNVTSLHMQSDNSQGQKLIGVAMALLFLAGMLSVGVGYFNLLPLPVLDGGHIVSCLFEMITGRKIPEQFERVGITAGLAVLGTFFILVTWQDMKRIGIFEFFDRLLS